MTTEREVQAHMAARPPGFPRGAWRARLGPVSDGPVEPLDERSCDYCDWMADRSRDDGRCERCGRVADRIEAMDAAEARAAGMATDAGWRVDRIHVAETLSRYVDVSRDCERSGCEETEDAIIRVADHMPGPRAEGTSWELDIEWPGGQVPPARWAALGRRLDRPADCGYHDE